MNHQIKSYHSPCRFGAQAERSRGDAGPAMIAQRAPWQAMLEQTDPVKMIRHRVSLTRSSHERTAPLFEVFWQAGPSQPEPAVLNSGVARPIRRRRETAEPGDVEGTVRALFDHYEEYGDFVIRNIADEGSVPELCDRLDTGRRLHRLSMQRQFAPQLAGIVGAQRRRTVDRLVVACDVYTWKLLRRDMGRSRHEAESCVRDIVTGILGET